MLLGDLSITDFANEIKNGKIIVPSIQRDFDYRKDEERITKLCDSVIKNLPIGMFLLYEKPLWCNTRIFGRRIFDRVDKDTKFGEYDTEVSGGQILVLDGQQRLQSLYLAVTDGSLEGGHLYYDIFFFRNKKSISDISFKFFKRDIKVIYDESDKSMYVRFADIIKMVERISRISPNNREREKKIILEELKVLIYPFKQLSDEDYDYIFDHLRDISFTLFFKGNSHILKYEIIKDKDFDDEILEMFVRFQGGLKLDKSDLIFSNIKLLWKDAGKKFEDLAGETGIGKDLLLKNLIVVSGFPSDTNLLRIRGNIESLRNNYEEFERIIKQFCDGVRRLTDRHDRIFKKFNFIIPIIFYFYKTKKLDKVGDLSVFSKVLKYMLIIVYNSDLRSADKLDKIIRIVKDERTDNFPLENIEEYLYNEGVKISIDEISLNSDPIFTFSLIQRNNWKPLYKNNKLHDDHIFPKGRIDELSEELRPLVHSIFNKYVVFAGDNIRKSDILPDEYFVGEKERFIDLYILPKEYLGRDRFDKMIEWRKNKIKDLFKKGLDLDICDTITPTAIFVPVEPPKTNTDPIVEPPKTKISDIGPTQTKISDIGPTKTRFKRSSFKTESWIDQIKEYVQKKEKRLGFRLNENWAVFTHTEKRSTKEGGKSVCWLNPTSNQIRLFTILPKEKHFGLIDAKGALFGKSEFKIKAEHDLKDAIEIILESFGYEDGKG